MTLTRPILPEGSWDSHMHVFDPKLQSYGDNTPYQPIPSTLSDALRFEASLGLRNIVLVQPSTYGFDNTCILDALEKIKPESTRRGVVGFDPDTIQFSTLRQWHALGVRGVRVNLKSAETKIDPTELERMLRKYANHIRPLGWVLQLYIPMEMIPTVERFLPDLDVKVCFDHFGSPNLSSSGNDPYKLAGFKSLVSILNRGKTYVKVSAAYRITNDPCMSDLEPLAKELIRLAGKKYLVFATDWPHTRFNNTDINPFIKACIEWCDGDQELISRIFRYNAEELWDV
ncbi:amidohydrolase 2 [Xylogone sp. PMI_703]|nr:amidohydrolase 2 [Xylogone sp. PMI_703]